MLVDVNFDFLKKETCLVNITMPLHIRNRITKVVMLHGYALKIPFIS